jgi:flagellar biosynthetic protein FliR
MDLNTLQLLQTSTPLFCTFTLLLARTMGVFLFAPFVGQHYVPGPVKMGAAGLVTFLLLPLVPVAPGFDPFHPFTFGYGVLRELLLGAFIGFTVQLLFFAIHWAVSILDFQSGFGMVHIVDPATMQPAYVMTQMMLILAALLFFHADGHHLVIQCLHATIGTIPLGQPVFSVAAMQGVVRLFTQLLLFAIRVIMPAFLTLSLIDLSLGVVGRVIRQMNIFIVIPPLKIGVALLVMAYTIPMFDRVMSTLLGTLQRDLPVILQSMK